MQHKKRFSKSLFTIATCLALIALGVVGGELFHFSYFEADKKINLIEILSIIVTLLVAWYVSKILDKEKQDGRTEKDLILKRTENLYSFVDSSHQKVISGIISYQEISSHLKRVNISIDSIYKLLATAGLTTDLAIKNSILANIKVLRDLMTNTPSSNEPSTSEVKPSIEVIKGIVYLNENRMTLVESEYDKLKDNILLMELSINQA